MCRQPPASLHSADSPCSRLRATASEDNAALTSRQAEYDHWQSWLQKYGYLPPTDPRMSVLRSAQTMQSAIAAMQRLYGINITGTLDRNTIDWMKKPRCGVPDQFGGISRFNVRRKRYALTGQKWHHKHITYRYQALRYNIKDKIQRSCNSEIN
ncbi:UNVERIFIED_CONTAM: hypothetical protein FKN15_074620 [Acipenser sinensis]